MATAGDRAALVLADQRLAEMTGVEFLAALQGCPLGSWTTG